MHVVRTLVKHDCGARAKTFTVIGIDDFTTLKFNLYLRVEIEASAR